MSGMWEGSKPAWLPDEFASLFGEYNAGTETKPFPIGDLPFGGNFCLARPCIDDIGDFPEHIGLVGMRTSAGFVRGRVGGEDSHVALRAARRGYELYYVPEASVQHIMSRERSTGEYFLRRLFDEGATQMSLFFSFPLLRFKGKIRRLGLALRDLCRFTVAVAVARFRSGPKRNPKKHMYKLGKLEMIKGSLSWLVRATLPAAACRLKCFNTVRDPEFLNGVADRQEDSN